MIKHNFTNFLKPVLISISTLIFGLVINRGFLPIGSIVGSEYELIRSSSNFSTYGRLGHRLLTPFLSKIFPDIQSFNIFVLFLILVLINYKNSEKFELYPIFLFSLSISTTMSILFTLNFVNYPDPMSIFIFLLLFFNFENKFLNLFFTFLLLINNEVGLFLLPILFLYFSPTLKRLAPLAVSIFLYLIYRSFIESLVNNKSSSINTYLDELYKLELNFFIIFGFFTGLKFLFFIIYFSNIRFKICAYLAFYLLIPMNMAVDYTRYSSLLITLIVVVIYKENLLSSKKVLFILHVIFLLNIITPKYYVWGGDILYLRDSRIHFIDLLGKSFLERSLVK